MVPLDHADRIRSAHVIHEDTGPGEKVAAALSKLSPDERNVAPPLRADGPHLEAGRAEGGPRGVPRRDRDFYLSSDSDAPGNSLLGPDTAAR